VQSVSFTQIQCEIPAIYTEASVQQYHNQGEAAILDRLMVKLDGKLSEALTDGQYDTYISSDSPSCNFTLDLGEELRANIQSMRYMPRINRDSSLYVGSRWEVSTDGTTFTTLETIDTSFHSGWNLISPTSNQNGIRVIRFIDPA
jgi:hypothetical protein